MKKVIFLVLAIILVQSVEARDIVIKFDDLPARSQKILTTHFDKSKIALIKKDPGFFNSYDVIFTDGNKIEFDNSGDWEEINCNNSNLPDSVVPNGIKSYVSKNYPNTSILDIKKDRGEIEIKLSNGLELTFDSNLNLIDID